MAATLSSRMAQHLAVSYLRSGEIELMAVSLEMYKLDWESKDLLKRQIIARR